VASMLFMRTVIHRGHRQVYSVVTYLHGNRLAGDTARGMAASLKGEPGRKRRG
jgi:hypothetical protein